jgi:N-formylglutamate amidohydrolase
MSRVVIWRSKNYTTWTLGNVPIILSCGHDGDAHPPGMLPRKKGKTSVCTLRDTHTRRLFQTLIESMTVRDYHTYNILGAVSRKYVDLNRSLELAVEDIHAIPIYNHFHNTLRRICQRVLNEFGTGLLLDIHGTSNNEFDIYLGTADWEATPDTTRVYELARRLDTVGYQTAVDYPRLTGGYIVQEHGWKNNPGIHALQIEIAASIRFDQEQRDLLAEHLVVVLEGILRRQGRLPGSKSSDLEPAHVEL